MSILTTITTSSVRVKMNPSSQYPSYPTYSLATSEAHVEIKSSKTREERRMVDSNSNRRLSASGPHDGGERYKERRGSKDTMRRKSSVAKSEGHKCTKRHGSVDSKREVLVIRG